MSAPLDELALIGSLLQLPIDEVRRGRQLFTREDLVDPRLQVVLDLIDDCLRRGVHPESASVVAAARTTGTVPAAQLASLGGLLIDASQAVAMPRWIDVYAASVVEASIRRRIVAASQRLLQASDSELETAASIVASEAAALMQTVARLQDSAAVVTR